MKPILLCFLEKFRDSGVKGSIEFDGSWGGVVIKYGDIVYDGSALSMEEALENALFCFYKEEARREIFDSLKDLK